MSSVYLKNINTANERKMHCLQRAVLRERGRAMRSETKKTNAMTENDIVDLQIKFNQSKT